MNLLEDCCDDSLFLALTRSFGTSVLVAEHLAAFRARSGKASLDVLYSEISRNILMPWRFYRRHLSRAAEDIDSCFFEAGVRYLNLRGPEFAKRYYPIPENRFSTDLDVLVQESDAERALEVLFANGFEHRPEETINAAYGRYMGQVELIHTRTRIPVDLNWRLSGNCGIGQVSPCMHSVWERAIAVDSCRYQLALTDEVVDLIRHVVHGHDFLEGVVKACCDLEALMIREGSKLDWSSVASALQELQCQRGASLFISFFLDTYLPYSGEEACHLVDMVPRNEFPLYRPSSNRIGKVVLSPDEVFDAPYKKALRATAVKFYAIDLRASCARLLLELCWPSKDVQILVVFAAGIRAPTPWNYLLIIVLLSPAIFFGIFANLCHQRVLSPSSPHLPSIHPS